MILSRTPGFHSSFIALLTASMRPPVYLELGSHENETLLSVQSLTREMGVKLMAVDKKEPHERLVDVDYFIMDTQVFLAERLPAMAKRLGVVFIDADHSYEAVKKDFEAVWPFVEEQGVVLLHDTLPEDRWETAVGFAGDAWRFAAELRERNFDSVTLPVVPGLTVVRKRERGHLAWRP